jgi:hypothetical protein
MTIELTETEVALLRELLQADAGDIRVEHHRSISHDAKVLFENREEVVKSLLARLTRVRETATEGMASAAPGAVR